MSDLKKLLANPLGLGPARVTAHKAVQLLSIVARANLKREPDDSHSNLEWSREKQAFLSHSLPAQNGPCQIGLSLSPLILVVLCNGEEASVLALADRSYSSALEWLDGQLAAHGLVAASTAKIPYKLPLEVAEIKTFPSVGAVEMEPLAAWFSLAVAALEPLVASLKEVSPGPSPIRCWPHHFDIATYVSLARGAAESAPAIGAGLSPGDEGYAQPYFYVNPWPAVDPNTLPEPIAPGHWHVEGYVGAVATGEEILSQSSIEDGTVTFLAKAFDAGKTALGA